MRTNSSDRHRREVSLGKVSWSMIALILFVGIYFQVNWMRKGVATQTQLENPTSRIPCYNCEGKGQVRDPSVIHLQMDCPVCFGLGSRTIRFVRGFHDYCGGCSGMGHVVGADGKTELCPVCRGWGVQESEAIVVSDDLDQKLNSITNQSSGASLRVLSREERDAIPDQLPSLSFPESSTPSQP